MFDIITRIIPEKIEVKYKTMDWLSAEEHVQRLVTDQFN